MKRMLLTIVGTIAGLVSLLSFKSHGKPIIAGQQLPAASLPGAGTTGAAPSTSHSPSAAKRTHATTGKAGSAASKSSAAPAATTKSYVGAEADTQYGIVQVKVTVQGSRITNVSFVQLTAFDGRSQEINSYAAPQLLQETLSAQSSRIDVVSGATYTSEGYIQSLQSALDAAGIK